MAKKIFEEKSLAWKFDIGRGVLHCEHVGVVPDVRPLCLQERPALPPLSKVVLHRVDHHISSKYFLQEFYVDATKSRFMH